MDYSKQWNWAFLVMVVFALLFGATALVKEGSEKEFPAPQKSGEAPSEDTEFDSGYGFSFRYHDTMAVLPGMTGPDDFFVVPVRENKPDLQNAIVIMSTTDAWTPYAKDSPEAIGWEPIEIDGEYAEYNKREVWVIALTPEGRSLSISAPFQDDELRKEMEYIVATMKFAR